MNSSITDLKDEFLDLKDIINKRSQEENQKLQSKCNKFEEKNFIWRKT